MNSYRDIEDILSYLSTKFNKIFCDREFVCCVTQDFQTILSNKNKCRVLVFPALGPIYLKAVRYQAKFFDLAVFNIGGGRYKLIAVCHKDHIIKKMSETVQEEPVMAEDVPGCSRRKRPAMQLYIPPAQRRSRLSQIKTESDNSVIEVPRNDVSQSVKSVSLASQRSVEKITKRSSRGKNGRARDENDPEKSEHLKSSNTNDEVLSTVGTRDSKQTECEKVENVSENIPILVQSSESVKNEEPCENILSSVHSHPNESKPASGSFKRSDAEENIASLMKPRDEEESHQVRYCRGKSENVSSPIASNDGEELMHVKNERLSDNISPPESENLKNGDANENVRLSASTSDNKESGSAKNEEAVEKNIPSSVESLDNEQPSAAEDFISRPVQVLFPLSDIVHAFHYLNLLPFNLDTKTTFDLRENISHHQSCAFKRYISSNYLGFQYNNEIPLYTLYDDFRINWCLNDMNVDVMGGKFQIASWKSFPVFSFDLDVCDEAEADKPTALLKLEEYCDFHYKSGETVDSNVYKIVCDLTNNERSIFYNVDLTLIDSGHCSIVSLKESSYFYECQEYHEPEICCPKKIKEFESMTSARTIEIANAAISDNEKNARNNKDTSEVTKSNKKQTIDSKNKNVDIKGVKETKDKSSHEEEKEIMRKTTKNINRKTRPIIKYVDDSNDTLTIDNKNDGVSNWEELFDDEGQIQEELLTEIVDKVGTDVIVVKANEDYTAYTNYTNKSSEDLEHIVELYNFPPSLETHDLVQAFSYLNSDSMYVKWVDDTHALLVLGSSSQAQKAMGANNPLIKVRPMTAASSIAMDIANRHDLRPKMKRPQTSLLTARRLITSHLGKKSTLSKEEIAKERETLKEAKEMKRRFRQNEQDAWDGKIPSVLK